jgi:hypothetical protein
VRPIYKYFLPSMAQNFLDLQFVILVDGSASLCDLEVLSHLWST